MCVTGNSVHTEIGTVGVCRPSQLDHTPGAIREHAKRLGTQKTEAAASFGQNKGSTYVEYCGQRHMRSTHTQATTAIAEGRDELKA